MARAPFLTNRTFNIDMDKLLCYKLWNILYFQPRNVLEDIWQVIFTNLFSSLRVLNMLISIWNMEIHEKSKKFTEHVSKVVLSSLGS